MTTARLLRTCLKISPRSAPVPGRSSVDLSHALTNPAPAGLRTLLRPRTGALRPGLAPPPKQIFKHTLRSVLRWTAGVCASLAVVVSAQQPAPPTTLPRNVWIESPPEPVDDWARHFRIGMLVGFNLKASFSMSGKFDVSGSQPGAPGAHGVDHFYDDGYVRVDETGNALGKTVFWGYHDPSQYNAAAQTLTFHSAQTFLTSGRSTGDGSPNFGFDLAYGGRLAHWGTARVGWEFGFGLLPINIKDTSPLVGIVSRTVHSFTTGGVLLPTAPYNGGFSGSGPTIDDVATALPEDTGPGTITGSRTIDTTLYVWRLGPLFQWELSPRLAVSLSAGPAIGLVSGDLKFDEVVTSGSSTGRNTGSVGGSDVVFGGYIGATLMYHAVPNGDIYVGVQYMPLGSAEISGGGRQARLDLSGGIYISAGINWPF